MTVSAFKTLEVHGLQVTRLLKDLPPILNNWLKMASQVKFKFINTAENIFIFVLYD